MPATEHAYVVWQSPDRWDPERKRWTSHQHLLLCGGCDIEEAAGELAETVALCNKDRHKERGFKHSEKDVEDAYKGAVAQLLSDYDYEAEWHDLQRKIVQHRLWGGPVPAAVLLHDPDERRQMNLVIPDPRTGRPTMYRLPKNPLAEVMPHPEEGKTAVRDPSGLGWYYKLPRQEAMRRRELRRAQRALHRATRKARHG